MIITDLTVMKMDHSDPRYPDPMPDRPFTDVYLCTATVANGRQYEASFFVFDDRAFAPNNAGDMLKLFSAAVAQLQVAQAA